MTVFPGKVEGLVTAPPSKSAMQRICAATWVSGAKAVIENPGDSADDRVVLALLEAAGCNLHLDGNGRLHIGALPASQHRLHHAHFGESGLAARMCIPILALAGQEVRLTADESLSRRPMQFFEDVLPSLGVTISLSAGRLPGTMSGKLQPRDITVDGSLSSQFISGLLMAFAGAGARGVRITVQHAVSTPYIDLTLDIMEKAGLKRPQRSTDGSLYFDAQEAPSPRAEPISFSVEGDWSAAAYWLVAGAIAGPVRVQGLDAFSLQADKAVLGPLMDCGALVSIEATQLQVGPAPLKAFHFNATDCPDLFPPLAVLACYASGTSVIEGVRRLVHKESNRADTISKELGRLGADISLQDDYMIIRGGRPLTGGAADSHDDHRIAMMVAIAALRAEGAVSISGAGAVDKSYPRFFEDLRALGVDCSPS